MKVLVGFILGLIVATTGFSSIAKVLDTGLEKAPVAIRS